jgi:hypothetical protein
MSEEEVKDPNGLLEAYNRLKEDIRRISAERDALSAEKDKWTEAAQENEWRSRALLAEVKAGLTSRGLKDADRIIKVLGTEGIEFDDNGNVTGLDERIKAASADFPELFDARVRAAGKADAHAQGTVEPTVDPLRQAVHNALNNRD